MTQDTASRLSIARGRAGFREELPSYVALFKSSVRANFAYRESILPSMVSSAISYAVPLLVWRHVYAASPHAPALPASTLFPYLLLAGCLNFAFGMNVEFRVGQRIRTGMIATDLLKPVDFQLAQASQAFSDGVFNMALCIPILGVAYLMLGGALFPAAPGALVLGAVSAALAFVIMFGVSFLFVQAAFFTYSGYGILAARNALQTTFSGLSAPLLLFPGWLRQASEWLPFRHTIHTPLSIYLGWVRGGDAMLLLLSQGAWAIALLVLGKAALAVSLRRLEIQGG